MEFNAILVILFVFLNALESSLAYSSRNSLNAMNTSNPTILSPNVAAQDYYCYNQTNGFNFKKKYSIEELRTFTFPKLISNDIDMDFKSGNVRDLIFFFNS